MYPSWLTVEYASTFLMSFCASPIVAAKIAVSPPTAAITSIAVGDILTIAFARATMYTPAVTIVAAWISADTGVGPAIASGSHTYSGSCADFPIAPTNSRSAIGVAAAAYFPASAFSNPSIPAMSTVPNTLNARKIASRNPKSPIRLTMNAFFPADAHHSFSK